MQYYPWILTVLSLTGAFLNSQCSAAALRWSYFIWIVANAGWIFHFIIKDDSIPEIVLFVIYFFIALRGFRKAIGL